MRPSKLFISGLIGALARQANRGVAQFLQAVLGGQLFHDRQPEGQFDQVGVLDLAVGFVDADELGALLQLFFGDKS